MKFVGIIDIDQRKKEMIRAQKAAALDPLTGLLNRRECEARVERYMQQGHNPAAMLLIDVDNFKQINDTYGHLFGDRVLKGNSGEPRAIFRHEDIAARIGGDEFVVFMTNLQRNNVIDSKVNAIRNIFDHYTDGETTCSIGCSIGVQLLPGTRHGFYVPVRKSGRRHVPGKEKRQGTVQYIWRTKGEHGRRSRGTKSPRPASNEGILP